MSGGDIDRRGYVLEEAKLILQGETLLPVTTKTKSDSDRALGGAQVPVVRRMLVQLRRGLPVRLPRPVRPGLPVLPRRFPRGRSSVGTLSQPHHHNPKVSQKDLNHVI
jgi:hypothetical protein